MQCKIFIKDYILKDEDEMKLLVHDIRRIAGLNKNDPLKYVYSGSDEGITNAYVQFNLRELDSFTVQDMLEDELGKYILSIKNPRGKLIQTEDTGTDFD